MKLIPLYSSSSFKHEVELHDNDSNEPNTQLTNTIELIRFQLKNEHYVSVKVDEILFAESADHYVKALIQLGGEKKWVIRHCTLKELQELLSPALFKRLNRFYMVNIKRLSSINTIKKILYFDSDFPVSIGHGIAPYLIYLLSQ